MTFGNSHLINKLRYTPIFFAACWTVTTFRALDLVLVLLLAKSLKYFQFYTTKLPLAGLYYFVIITLQCQLLHI